MVARKRDLARLASSARLRSRSASSRARSSSMINRSRWAPVVQHVAGVLLQPPGKLDEEHLDDHRHRAQHDVKRRGFEQAAGEMPSVMNPVPVMTTGM